MRIAIFTLGTRGDVQPYIALGSQAIKQGHSVVICTGESFKDLITKNNIEYAKAELDYFKILQTKEGQEIFNNGTKHIIKAIKYAKEKVNPAFRDTLEQFYNSAKNADVIIYHPKALGAQDISVKLNIPCVCVAPVPFIYPIDELPNLAVSPSGNFGKTLNKLSYAPVKYSDGGNINEINDFRQKVLNFKKRKSGAYTYEVEGKSVPIVYTVSRYLFEDVKSWEDNVYLSGFTFLENEEKLSEDIIEFISKGSAPIVISFSSMPLSDPNKFKEILIKSLNKTNNRAIVLTGISGMNFDNEDKILAINSAPHNLLFPLSKGILHHGGAGTMASALKSGKPQLIMPFSVDQPFWANRLYKKGYALEPIFEKNLSVDKLVKAFENMDKEENILASIDMKNKLELENGNENIVKYIENVYLNVKQI